MANDEYEPTGWDAPRGMSRGRGSWSRMATRGGKALSVWRPTTAKRTRGAAGGGEACFVYAAAGRRGIKIGITSDPQKRAKDVRARLVYSLEVVRDAARDVEGLALTMLGRYNDMPGEWAVATEDEAIKALRGAWAAVGRFRHVDPDLTPDEARRQRIAACKS
jgi:hypothetical protein